MPPVRTTRLVNVPATGMAMLLALSGCAAASPSATSSRSASEPAAASPTPVEPRAATWTTTGHMLEARTRHTATLLRDGRVLVAGGSGASGGLTSAEVYDPSSGSWTTTRNMTMARDGETATLLGNGKVLVAGGLGSGSFSQMRTAEHSAELY